MFNCYIHGWSSHHSTCPACPQQVSTSTDFTFTTYKQEQSETIANLRQENERLREENAMLFKNLNEVECHIDEELYPRVKSRVEKVLTDYEKRREAISTTKKGGEYERG